MFLFLKNLFQKKKPYVDENGNEEASRLPKVMPADFSVELRFGGGMRMTGTVINLKLGESTFYKYSDTNQHSHCTFILSEAELKEVFDDLHRNKFDKVEMEENLRLDYPSTTLTASWDKKFIPQHTGQVYTVKENSAGNFDACVGLVRSIGYTKSKQCLVSVQILLEKPLQKPDSGFAIYFNNESIEGPYPWYEASSGKSPEPLNLLPGVYLFKCYRYDPELKVFTISKPIRYSTYIYLTVPEKQAVVLTISTNGYSFSHEVN